MKYSKEVKDFIRNNVKGRTTKELVELVNKEMGTDFTESKMKSYKTNHKLRSGTPVGNKPGMPTKMYPQKVKNYMKSNCVGTSPGRMADILNEKFGTQYTHKQIRSYYKNHGLRCGLDARFKEGQVPPNKGKKGYYSPGCEKTWFKKGHTPENYRPIGSERVNVDGYIEIKTSDPNSWSLKHRVIYEDHHGKIPEKHVVVFLDGNQLNTSIDNLKLISQQELLVMNRNGLFSDDADLTEVGVAVAKLKCKIYEKVR